MVVGSPPVSLEVHLRHCRNLGRGGTFVKQAPFCVLSWSSQQYRSRTHANGGKDPVWNQLFTFITYQQDAILLPLRLEFFDECMFSSNKPIGEGRVMLGKVLEAGTLSMIVPVMRDGVRGGDCHLTIRVKGVEQVQASIVALPQPLKQVQHKAAGKLATAPAPVTPSPPTTLSPTTHSPATTSPATTSRATLSPTAQSPAAHSPAALSPAAQSPAMQSPATQSPATQSPVTSSLARGSSARRSFAAPSPATPSAVTLSPATLLPATPMPAAPLPPAPPPATLTSATYTPPKLQPCPSGHAPSQFILPTYANTNCWADYEKGRLLGKGNFGKTYVAVHKVTRKEYAVKVIAKRMLSTRESIQDIKNEVEVMHHLAGHPNVVRLEQVYEDRDAVCLVMELMRGGELFEAISEKGVYTEKDAAALIRDIVSVIAKCHAESVIHRDIKPENFLLTDRGPHAKLKAADFGLSTFFLEGQRFTDVVGSLYYMAPEVLRHNYCKEADIWSCGVILYILLSGRPPFGAHGKNEHEVFDAIKHEALDLQSPPWDNISEPAKDCIRRMLKRDPRHRAKAQDILNNDWLREHGCADDNLIEVGVVSRMRQFNHGNKLKKAVTQMMVGKLPMDEINGLREIFLAMDKQQTGRVTLPEFTKALKLMGAKLPEVELRAMWQDVDNDGDGTLLYEEFLAATIHEVKLQREDRMKAAFIRFDTDGDGFIGLADLQRGLKEENISADDIEDIIRQVDRDGAGTIDYNEFVVMMRSRD